MYQLVKLCRKTTPFCIIFSFGILIFLHSPARSVPSPNTQLREKSSTSEARKLLFLGIRHYEAEQFFEASEAWHQAAYAYENIGDITNQALSLSNLSLAYQNLGDWQQAEDSVFASLTILDDLGARDSTQEVMEIRAKALNTQGHLYFALSKPDQALEIWKRATQSYFHSGNEAGVILGKLNQAKALHNLGLTHKALELLDILQDHLQKQDNHYLKATGLRQLGRALRSVGNHDRSVQILNAGLTVATSSSQRQLMFLELGHSYQALGKRAISTNKLAQSPEQMALHYYEKAAQLGGGATHLLAQVSQFRLLAQMGQRERAMTLWAQIRPSLVQRPPSRSGIYRQLQVAHGLTCLQLDRQKSELPCSHLSWRDSRRDPRLIQSSIWHDIARMIAYAQQQAIELEDPIADSYALGQLGNLYELTGQWESAQDLTQRALAVIEGRSAHDLRYRWEWQLGRLWRLQGKNADAIAAYTRSIEALELVRDDLVQIDPEVQFSFRDDVEPVYREFVDLLLSPASGQPNQANLKLAIQNIDALQLAELENFLDCDLSELVRITDAVSDPTAAKLYPILLPDRLAIIYEIPGQPLAYQQVQVPQLEVEAVLKTLRQELTQPNQTPEVLKPAQQVYEWLIAPLEPILASQPQIKTLVFVLDGSFRNIPMGVLYDGQKYLIEKNYGLAVSPRLNLFRPVNSPRRLDLFTGGVGVAQVLGEFEFPAIAQHQEELERVGAIAKSNKPLINEAFTQTNISRRLQTRRFSGIHWKTHGVFSSDPSQTYLVAYQERIQARDLDRLLQVGTQGGIEPLELLVLSACETAQGDNRAVLGLAGVAVRAGARSTVSTLWRADDRANTELMTRFYQGLSQGMTKAQALQQAQVALIQDFNYQAPYVWAPYVLVGNWQ